MSTVVTRAKSAKMGDNNSSNVTDFDISLCISEFTPSTDAESFLLNCVKSLLTKINVLQDEVTKLSTSNEETQFSNVGLQRTVNELQKDSELITIMAAKAEQYTRRDTIIVSGVDMLPDEQESDLTKKVTVELRKSGHEVSADDFTAIHRNGNSNKTITRDNKEIVVSPSITVKFRNINKHDRVVRDYKNFDKSANKKRKVRIYQSLSVYYKTLKESINDYCTKNKYGVLWAHWRSPSCGFAVKMKAGNKLLTGIHCMSDFQNKLHE